MESSSCQIQSTDAPLAHGASQALVCAPAESSIGDAGGAALDLQMELNSTCEGIALSAPASEQSTGGDNPQAPGWTKIIRMGRAPDERPPCAARMSALEMALPSYAEKKTKTVIVPALGSNFDTLGEAYGYYNLYSWEIGLGVRYGKRRLNVEKEQNACRR
ncbi:uncharacterized protein LOC125521217 [Triticum urartu]|uniref:uncharacterized protein LOC125521217 n=1 Tax=Triticum urartu TaxID=4572 RepID=UPI002044A935|nr:uncharacterized protein LOC125521217 [Triticum urartu]